MRLRCEVEGKFDPQHIGEADVAPIRSSDRCDLYHKRTSGNGKKKESMLDAIFSQPITNYGVWKQS